MGYLLALLGMTWVIAPTAFVGVSVLPMSTDTLLPDQTVLVERGVVTQIGPRSVVRVPGGTSKSA